MKGSNYYQFCCTCKRFSVQSSIQGWTPDLSLKAPPEQWECGLASQQATYTSSNLLQHKASEELVFNQACTAQWGLVSVCGRWVLPGAPN